MKNIKYFKRTDIKAPIMIASWPGIGNVGYQAADYIRHKLNAELLCEIDTSALIVPDAISVNNGISVMPKPPDISVFFSKKPPLLISLGKEQLYGQAGFSAMEMLLDIAVKSDVKKIFTGAAFPIYMSHLERPQVHVVANSGSVLKKLKRDHGIIAMKEGQISGLNGLLLEAARKRKLEAACLLATLPIYAIGLSNPKASKAIINVFGNMLKVHIDMTELDISIHEIDKMLQEIEEQLKSLGMAEHKERLPAEGTEELPKNVVDKIEGMFKQAEKDKKVAHRLKQELDRWNLFKFYEDRFLDLFREGQ